MTQLNGAQSPIDNACQSGNPTGQSYEQASAFIAAIGASSELCNFRAIKDKDKGVSAIKRRGTLAQHWQELCALNNQEYGIFITIAKMDGSGYDDGGFPIKDENGKTRFGDSMANVAAIRAHYIDLDDLNAMANRDLASIFNPMPQFWVQSSPNKAHVYWVLKKRYTNNEAFSTLQAKAAQYFSGDHKITDPTRVMRLPGTLNCKGVPHLVTCQQLYGWGSLVLPEDLQGALSHVNVIAKAGGKRRSLGDAELAAPSVEMIDFAFQCADPNTDRDDWIKFMSAIKQAAWNLMDSQEVQDRFMQWCERYHTNNPAENLKQWNDIQETQIGWKWIEKKYPKVKARRVLGAARAATIPVQGAAPPMPQGDNATTPPVPNMTTTTGDILTAEEQAGWFKGCIYIADAVKIRTASGMMMGKEAFNAYFGGKLFILDSNGKTTDEAWKAATRGRVFKVKTVHRTEWNPTKTPDSINIDTDGHSVLNTYRPANVKQLAGDPSRFIELIGKLVPIETDRKILLEWLAHTIKYPGFKIRWAVFLQSDVEGVGKGIIANCLDYALGDDRLWNLDGKKFAASDKTFNLWAGKSLVLYVKEAGVANSNTLAGKLLDLISDDKIEIEGKGADQKSGRNFLNVIIDSNHKSSVTIKKSGRRYAPFFMPFSSTDDLIAAGLTEDYFAKLNHWLSNEDGYAIVAAWFHSFDIARGSLPVRAPRTSYFEEATRESLHGAAAMIMSAIEAEEDGFRNGYIVASTAMDYLQRNGYSKTHARTVADAIKQLPVNYYKIERPDGGKHQTRVGAKKTAIYSTNPAATFEAFHGASGAQSATAFGGMIMPMPISTTRN